MGNVGKSLALALVFVMAISSASLLTVKPASGQTIPKPSVPEFNVRYNNSVTNTTDPFTGINVMQITIRNQPFEYSFNGTDYHLYYNFRTKPHSGDANWTVQYPIEEKQAAPYSFSQFLDPYTPLQTNSDFTVITCSLSAIVGFPSEGDMDIQVQAIVGHNSQVYVSDLRFAPGQYETAIAFDKESDWSPTQTITIGQSSSVPEFPALAILPLLIVMFSVAVLVRHRKTANLSK